MVGVPNMIRMGRGDGLDVFGLFTGGSGGRIVCVVGLDRGRGDEFGCCSWLFTCWHAHFDNYNLMSQRML